MIRTKHNLQKMGGAKSLKKRGCKIAKKKEGVLNAQLAKDRGKSAIKPKF